MSAPVKLNTNSSPSISIAVFQNIIGVLVAAFFNAGLLFFGLTCLSGAFFPGCPFRSAFSSAIQLIFEISRKLFKWILHGLFCGRALRRQLPSDREQLIIQIVIDVFMGILPIAMLYIIIPLEYTVNIGIWSSLSFLISASLSLAYFAKQKADYYPQKYKISQLALWGFLPNSVLMSSVMWFQSSIFDTAGIGDDFLTIMNVFGVLITFISNVICGKMSKSMAVTGEIDAIAWLLKTSPSPHSVEPPLNLAELFKKAGQMTVSKPGSDYRPRLLESLFPFLSLLITSYHLPRLPSPGSDTPPPSSNAEDSDSKRERENTEIYTACLAQLSDFSDSRGKALVFWEDTMRHPVLEQPLVDKLVQFTKLDSRHHFPDHLKSAATQVLKNYNLESLIGNNEPEARSGHPATHDEAPHHDPVLHSSGDIV